MGGSRTWHKGHESRGEEVTLFSSFFDLVTLCKSEPVLGEDHSSTLLLPSDTEVAASTSDCVENLVTLFGCVLFIFKVTSS